MAKSLRKRKIRQLTKKEKILLILLGIVILFWLSYRFIYIAQVEKMKALSLEKIEYEAAIQDINLILRREKSINNEWYDLNEKKKKIIASYFPTLDQAQIIYLLNDLTSHEDVEIQDISFSRPSMTDFEDFQVRSMDISIPYSGKYQGIIDILDSIKNSPRKIAVNYLSIDRSSDGNLNGNMDLKIYSLDGIAESDKDIIYIDTSSAKEKDNPFSGYESYEKGMSEEGELDADEVELKPYIEDILLDFESRNCYFVPSQELVKGDVSLSTNSKSKRHSLKLEYNIIAIDEENRAFIDVTKNRIVLKYPPNSIGIWIYSYDYSPVTFGIGFKGQMGEDILVPFTEGIGWTGWKYIETNPPEELSLYPLKLERLYLEIPSDRDNYGVLLIDKLEAMYTRNIDEDGNDSSIGDFIFHVVDRGDTLEKISENYYGVKTYKDEIRKLNELKTGDILPVGKVLVLKKH